MYVCVVHSERSAVLIVEVYVCECESFSSTLGVLLLPNAAAAIICVVRLSIVALVASSRPNVLTPVLSNIEWAIVYCSVPTVSYSSSSIQIALLQPHTTIELIKRTNGNHLLSCFTLLAVTTTQCVTSHYTKDSHSDKLTVHMPTT